MTARPIQLAPDLDPDAVHPAAITFPLWLEQLREAERKASGYCTGNINTRSGWHSCELDAGHDGYCFGGCGYFLGFKMDLSGAVRAAEKRRVLDECSARDLPPADPNHARWLDG